MPAEASELLDFAGRWGRERVPQRSPFRVGTHLRENRHGRTGADSAYLLHAGTPGFGFADGQVYAVHAAWSGNHVHYAERTFNGDRVLGGGELLLAGEVRLATGERYTSPWLYGAFGIGLDAIARRFHAHLRSRPRPVSADRPITLNVWEAVYFDHDLEHLIDLAERAAKVGVERYVLDDGWFGARRHETAGLGDWVVATDAWPDGLHPLVEHVRALGMQFGLWFEPEMVNPDSDVARAHPEWIMAARREWPVESRFQQVLNLAIPAAYEHVKGQMLAILDEYRLDFIKWDHNRDLIEAGDQLAGGRAGVHAQTAACYRLLDELRAAHPGLEIESCSSGGGSRRPRRARAHRSDLGVRLHRPVGAPAHHALDDAARGARVPRLAHRVRAVPHHRPRAQPELPRRHRRVRPPRHRVGPVGGVGRGARRAGGVADVLQDPPPAAARRRRRAHGRLRRPPAGPRRRRPRSVARRSSPWPPSAASTPGPARGCASAASTGDGPTGCAR